eukprot:TRINITY_DN41613_c0_g1_i1.p1 TRINITY_DN41613_c0_g1~~TRINITY_DN41613_c0_g1_i1.p1  ORF type:complete len:346 (+),score=78.07 TRINITY_DN41613_c0_g1_i1:78-1115(+)
MHGRPRSFGSSLSKVATKLQRPQPASDSSRSNVASTAAPEPEPVYSLGRGGAASLYPSDGAGGGVQEQQGDKGAKRLPLHLSAKSARKAAGRAGKVASSQATKMVAASSQASKMASSFARKLGRQKSQDGGQYQPAEGLEAAAQVVGAVDEDDENSAMIAGDGTVESNDIECGQDSSLLLHSSSRESSPSSRTRSPCALDRLHSDLSSSGYPGSQADAHGTSGSEGERSRTTSKRSKDDVDMWDAKAFGNVRPSQLGSIWDIPTSQCPIPEPKPTRTTATAKSPVTEQPLPSLAVRIANDSYGLASPEGARDKGWSPSSALATAAKIICLVLALIAMALSAAKFM